MKRVLRVLCILMMLSVDLSPLFAEELAPQIQKGYEYHNRARNPDEKNPGAMLDECLKCLEPYTNTDAIACGLYGSALTVKASLAVNGNPIKSLKYLEEGNEFIDKAVAMKPDEIFCRLLRLENGIEVSRTSPVKRYGVIKNDVEFFIDDGKVEELSDDDKSEAYLYSGFYYLDSGDLDFALELFELAEEAAPDSKSGKRAQKMLDKYSE